MCIGQHLVQNGPRGFPAIFLDQIPRQARQDGMADPPIASRDGAMERFETIFPCFVLVTEEAICLVQHAEEIQDIGVAAVLQELDSPFVVRNGFGVQPM